jgi:flagellar motor switch protein FliG
MSTPNEAEGVENAAILLMSIGEEDAAEVFKHLKPKEVQKLGETISKLKNVTRDRVTSVLDQFNAQAAEQSMLVNDNDDYIKSVLRRALGDDKANILIDRILQSGETAGIESLKWMDAASVAELLRMEHPQIVAAILVHLDPDHASKVLKHFVERQRNEVLVRIATLDGIQPSALKDLNEVMARVLAGSEHSRKSNLGGVKTAAEMINMLGSSIETATLDYIREGRQRPGAEDHGQHVHFRRFAGRGRQRHSIAAQGSAVGVFGHRTQRGAARTARKNLQEHVHARCRSAARRPGHARAGAGVRGRNRAKRNAQNRAPFGRRRADHFGCRRRK